MLEEMFAQVVGDHQLLTFQAAVNVPNSLPCHSAWDYSLVNAKSLGTCWLRRTREQSAELWEPQAEREPTNLKIKGILETGEGIVTSVFIDKQAEKPR